MHAWDLTCKMNWMHIVVWFAPSSTEGGMHHQVSAALPFTFPTDINITVGNNKQTTNTICETAHFSFRSDVEVRNSHNKLKLSDFIVVRLGDYVQWQSWQLHMRWHDKTHRWLDSREARPREARQKRGVGTGETRRLAVTTAAPQMRLKWHLHALRSKTLVENSYLQNGPLVTP